MGFRKTTTLALVNSRPWHWPPGMHHASSSREALTNDDGGPSSSTRCRHCCWGRAATEAAPHQSTSCRASAHARASLSQTRTKVGKQEESAGRQPRMQRLWGWANIAWRILGVTKATPLSLLTSSMARPIICSRSRSMGCHLAAGHHHGHCGPRTLPGSEPRSAQQGSLFATFKWQIDKQHSDPKGRRLPARQDGVDPCWWRSAFARG